MAAIFGKTKRLSGDLYLYGKKVQINKPADAVAHGLALVTENRKVDGFIGRLSLKRNLTMASIDNLKKGLFMNERKEDQEAQQFFDALDVKAPGLDTFAETLSGGNQQKIVIGKWLMTDPKILILDEPTKGIDIAAKNSIYNLMTELTERGISIIMISSEMPELCNMSDRVIVLAEGRVQGTVTGAEIDQLKIMEMATNGQARNE